MPDVLEPYKKLIKFMGEVIGPGCCLVLYDFAHGTAAAEAVAIAGYARKDIEVGSPPTDLAKKVIADEDWKCMDYIANFRSESKDGRVFSSSAYFIKKNGKLVGMISINRDITKMRDITRALMQQMGLIPDDVIGKPAQKNRGRLYAENVSSIDEMIETVIKERFNDTECPDRYRMTQKERIDIIKELRSRGAFLVRGAVSAVAGRLGCSEASVYRYLAKIKK